jgi:hypothetical protein
MTLLDGLLLLRGQPVQLGLPKNVRTGIASTRSRSMAWSAVVFGEYHRWRRELRY